MDAVNFHLVISLFVQRTRRQCLRLDAVLTGWSKQVRITAKNSKLACDYCRCSEDNRWLSALSMLPWYAVCTLVSPISVGFSKYRFKLSSSNSGSDAAASVITTCSTGDANDFLQQFQANTRKLFHFVTIFGKLRALPCACISFVYLAFAEFAQVPTTISMPADLCFFLFFCQIRRYLSFQPLRVLEDGSTAQVRAILWVLCHF